MRYKIEKVGLINRIGEEAFFHGWKISNLDKGGYVVLDGAYIGGMEEGALDKVQIGGWYINQLIDISKEYLNNGGHVDEAKLVRDWNSTAMIDMGVYYDPPTYIAPTHTLGGWDE